MFPKLNFTSFSNSRTQVKHIQTEAKKRGLTNINVHVEDYQDFCTEKSVLHGKTFSRVFAIETIEYGYPNGFLFYTCSVFYGVFFISFLVYIHIYIYIGGREREREREREIRGPR